MEVFAEIDPLQTFLSSRRKQCRVALVPTMGALHAGHRACVDVARDVDRSLVVASIFVNPTQFAAGEDLSNYPRPLDADLTLCEAWGCDVVFAPDTDTMYTGRQRTWVEVEGLTAPLCGRTRPGHFRGVATVVSKLFNIVMPDVAVFGQKDAQQALVIRELIRQLNYAVELRIAPIARETDGLALSSRNAYLGSAERQTAPAVYRSLEHAAGAITDGERKPSRVQAAIRERLVAGGIDEIEYVEVLSAENLSALEEIEGKVIIAIAVKIGATRLIDNMVFDIDRDRVVVDSTLF